MAEVTLKINNKEYSLSCDDGQEPRLEDLACYVDSRLQDISSAGAATSENHLLVLTNLVLADEVYELRDQLETLQNDIRNLQAGRPVEQSSARSTEEEEMIAKAIDHFAGKIENIASRIQTSEAA